MARIVSTSALPRQHRCRSRRTSSSYGPLFLLGALGEVSNAYAQALAAGHAAAGTYTWSGVGYLQNPLAFTVDQGQVTQVGGAFTSIVYVLWAIGTIACGRLWRLLPLASRGQHTSATEN